MIDTDERALADCPFCGNAPTLRHPTTDDGFAIHVSCRCGAQLYGHRHHFSSDEEAIAAWNRRLAQPDQSEPVFWMPEGLAGVCAAIAHAQDEHRVILSTKRKGVFTAPLYTHPDRTQAPGESGEWRPIETLPSMKQVALYHPRFGATKMPRITHEYSGIDPRTFGADGYTHWREPMQPPAAAPTPPSVPGKGAES